MCRLGENRGVRQITTTTTTNTDDTDVIAKTAWTVPIAFLSWTSHDTSSLFMFMFIWVDIHQYVASTRCKENKFLLIWLIFNLCQLIFIAILPYSLDIYQIHLFLISAFFFRIMSIIFEKIIIVYREHTMIFENKNCLYNNIHQECSLISSSI